MNSDELRQQAEQYVEQQLRTLAEHGSRPTISSEAREDMVVSAMKAAGYGVETVE